MARISYSQSLSNAMAEEMRRDSTIILMGEDIGHFGGAFGATCDLYNEFGPERVMDMPISEAGYVGAAVGAAATGLRPIAELQFTDWITIASDQLVNQAAKMRYMFGGVLSIPLVLRAPVGGYIQAAAQHSQMFDAWVSYVPGLKVVLPSTPIDAKGLLKSAIRDNSPVMFFEHKKLYDMVDEVPDDTNFLIPIGKADIKREGSDVTIITYSFMVHKALEAASILEKEGISAEVVDLRTVKPLDKETIITSVKKTSKVLCFQEAWLTCSIMSEVAAVLAEEAFDYLDAPVKRLGARDAPIPFSPVLESYVLPGVNDVVNIIKEMF
jgi:pyruvate/2-oxoglutarate/acetoin dehydrogenase E1 component